MANLILAPTLHEALRALADRIGRAEARGQRNLVFCEDSLTLLAERAVLERTGGTFLTEVTTFARFLSEEAAGRVLSKHGSVMAVSAILAESRDLSCFSERAAETVYETLAQMAASRVDAAQLRAGAQKTEGTLRAKLSDLALLSERYAAFLAKTGVLDESGYLALLPSAVGRRAKGINVFFVAFPSFTRQSAEGIAAAAEHAADVTGIFCAGKGALYTNEAARVFGDVCREAGADVVRTVLPSTLPEEAERVRTGLFEPEVFSAPPVGAKRVRLFTARDEAAEADAVCALIKRHLDEGARCRDIIVLAPDEGSRLVLEKALSAYRIPYSSDRKRPLSRHPFVRFAVSCLTAVADGGRPESVDAVAANVCFGEADEYRNYLARYGCYRGGYRREIREDAGDAALRSRLGAFRRRMMDALACFPKTGRAQEFAAGLDALRRLVGADEVLSALASRVEAAEQAFLAPEKLDALTAELFAAGERQLTAREFAALYESGASALKISMIPSLADAVYLGDATDSRVVRAKYLFLTGLSDLLPRTGEDTSVITDGEIARLAALSVNVEPAISVVNARAREALGLNACAFSEALYASRPLKVRGEERAAGEAYVYLAGLFSSAPLPPRFPYDCSERTPALLALFSAKADFEEGRENDVRRFSSIWAALSARLGEETLRALSESGTKRAVPEAAALLFAGETSPTLLENYFACPYAGFMKSALRLSEREEGRSRTRDAGTFVHKVLERMGDAFNTLSSEEACRAAARDAARQLMQEAGYFVFDDSGEGRYAGGRLIAECEKVACAVYASLRSSAFRIRGGEEELRLPALGLRGRADRVDEAGEYVRIIDYKTGAFDPTLTAYYTGRSLQLELYLLAAAGGGKPAGAFYFPAEDKFTGEDEQKFCMKGFYDADAAGLFGGEDASFGGTGLKGEAFADFLSYGVLVAEGAQREMKAGNIRPSPYKDSCTYCAFRGACGFTGEERTHAAVRAADIAAIAREEREKGA